MKNKETNQKLNDLKISGEVELYSKIRPSLRGLWHIIIGKPLLVNVILEDVPVKFTKSKSEKHLELHK